MPEETNLDFEHEILEADIQRLAQEIKAHKERPESKNLGDQEILKAAIQSLAAESQTTPTIQQQTLSPLPDYAQNASAETKLEIEYLLDIAFHRGIAKANAEAKKSNAFVLDAFHDALAGKLYPEFQKRGLLK